MDFTGFVELGLSVLALSPRWSHILEVGNQKIVGHKPEERDNNLGVKCSFFVNFYSELCGDMRGTQRKRHCPYFHTASLGNFAKFHAALQIAVAPSNLCLWMRRERETQSRRNQ